MRFLFHRFKTLKTDPKTQQCCMDDHSTTEQVKRMNKSIYSQKGRAVKALVAMAASMFISVSAFAQSSDPAPNRAPGEGEGPYQRLIIRGAIMIDGAGAPPSGPTDIVIEGNKIKSVHTVGYVGAPIDPAKRPTGATKEIDATGMYVKIG